MSELEFPEIPDVVRNLTSLEERLVAPRIPFMKIFGLGCDSQFGLTAGVINVPVDVPKMFKMVPIKPEQASVIHLKLIRKLSYKSHYKYERIRKENVHEAGQLFVETELYQLEGVSFDTTWQDQNITEFNADPEETTSPEVEEVSEETNDIENDPDEPVNEEVVEQNLYEETLMDSNTLVEIAPGESEHPLSILLDTYCEELSFPTIWFGHRRTCSPDVKLSYEDHILSEIMRSDQWAVRADHLLFVHKKSQLKQLCSNLNIALKKKAQSSEVRPKKF
jgi:hypothetical protein